MVINLLDNFVQITDFFLGMGGPCREPIFKPVIETVDKLKPIYVLPGFDSTPEEIILMIFVPAEPQDPRLIFPLPSIFKEFLIMKIEKVVDEASKKVIVSRDSAEVKVKADCTVDSELEGLSNSSKRFRSLQIKEEFFKTRDDVINSHKKIDAIIEKLCRGKSKIFEGAKFGMILEDMMGIQRGPFPQAKLT
jgi:hypothetical protein